MVFNLYVSHDVVNVYFLELLQNVGTSLDFGEAAFLFRREIGHVGLFIFQLLLLTPVNLNQFFYSLGMFERVGTKFRATSENRIQSLSDELSIPFTPMPQSGVSHHWQVLLGDFGSKKMLERFEPGLWNHFITVRDDEQGVHIHHLNDVYVLLLRKVYFQSSIQPALQIVGNGRNKKPREFGNESLDIVVEIIIERSVRRVQYHPLDSELNSVLIVDTQDFLPNVVVEELLEEKRDEFVVVFWKQLGPLKSDFVSANFVSLNLPLVLLLVQDVQKLAFMGNKGLVELKHCVAANGSSPKDEIAALEIEVEFEKDEEKVHFFVKTETDWSLGSSPTSSGIIDAVVEAEFLAILQETHPLVLAACKGMGIDDGGGLGVGESVLEEDEREDDSVKGNQVDFVDGEGVEVLLLFEIIIPGIESRRSSDFFQ